MSWLAAPVALAQLLKSLTGGACEGGSGFTAHIIRPLTCLEIPLKIDRFVTAAPFSAKADLDAYICLPDLGK